MTSMLVRRTLLLAVIVAGCGPRIAKPPAGKEVKLGDKTATYRDWSTVNVCAAEPQKLAGDLNSMNDLLTTFLSSTSAGKDGVWSDEQLAMIQDAPRLLDVPLRTLDYTVKAAQRCKYPASANLAEPLARAEELGRQGRARLAEAPELYAHLSVKRDLERWRQAQEAEIRTAREVTCPAKPRPGSADVFYAAHAEGVTEWHLCDGSKVALKAGGKPEYQPTPEAKKARRPAKVFLDAAAKFPAANIRQAPTPGAAAAPTPAAADAGTPGAHDAGTSPAAPAPSAKGDGGTPAAPDAGTAAKK